MHPFETNEALVEAAARNADACRITARGPGGRPVVVAEAGGDREPPIVLTAGAHATEQAGVVAAVELLDRLETDHRVLVVPTRDPLGVDGYEAALAMALGESISVDDYDDLENLLRKEATVLVDQDGVLVGLVGDYAFATTRPTDGKSSMKVLWNVFEEVEDTPAIEALRGRRVFLVPGQAAVEGTGDFGRLYTLVVSPTGEVRHLNRYVDSEWAPPESRAVRDLFEATNPGLFVDLHEYEGDGCWVSVRPKADEAVERRERAVGRAMVEAIESAGGRPLPLADLFSGTLDDHYFTELRPGLYDLDYRARGEGFNATDYAAEHHGLAFTNETGMYLPFEERVEVAVSAVQRAVDEFERRRE